mmetsp:Transcript_28280/g.61918  ORF Transcript_28280/g.61918 Transcript_28280/m.61918 type:complete len:205 (-) Transcript_28280:22-636(-)
MRSSAVGSAPCEDEPGPSFSKRRWPQNWWPEKEMTRGKKPRSKTLATDESVAAGITCFLRLSTKTESRSSISLIRPRSLLGSQKKAATSSFFLSKVSSAEEKTFFSLRSCAVDLRSGCSRIIHLSSRAWGSEIVPSGSSLSLACSAVSAEVAMSQYSTLSPKKGRPASSSYTRSPAAHESNCGLITIGSCERRSAMRAASSGGQ